MAAVDAADQALWYKSAAVNWDIEVSCSGCGIPAAVCDDIEQLLASAIAQLDGAEKSHIVVMSNGGFEGFHQRLVAALQ